MKGVFISSGSLVLSSDKFVVGESIRNFIVGWGICVFVKGCWLVLSIKVFLCI